jgi:integrase
MRKTLDKTMNGRKTGNTGRDDSDRKHLTRRELERLIEATRGSRNEARDRCLLLLMFRHGLRVSEACRMKLDQVDVESRVLHVTRLKGGLSCWLYSILPLNIFQPFQRILSLAAIHSEGLLIRAAASSLKTSVSSAGPGDPAHSRLSNHPPSNERRRLPF